MIERKHIEPYRNCGGSSVVAHFIRYQNNKCRAVASFIIYAENETVKV